MTASSVKGSFTSLLITDKVHCSGTVHYSASLAEEGKGAEILSVSSGPRRVHGMYLSLNKCL